MLADLLDALERDIAVRRFVLQSRASLERLGRADAAEENADVLSA